MAGEPEVKRMVAQVIELGKLLAEADRQYTNERKQPEQTAMEMSRSHFKRFSCDFREWIG